MRFIKTRNQLALAVIGVALLAACSKTTTETDKSTDTMTQTEKQLAAPIARKEPKEITQQGYTRVDNYAWMKDDNWQEVLRDPTLLRADIREHLEAEVAYYEASTDHLEPLRKKLFEEMKGRIKEDDSTVPVREGDFEYYSRFREGGNYPIFARKPVGSDAETILYDGDKEEGDSPFFSIGDVSNSPNHEMIAYGVDRLGSEYYTIQVRDIATGQDIGEAIPSTDGSVVWAADSKSFFYTERDDNQRPKWIKYHVLGTDPAQDKVVYEEADDGMFIGLGKTQSGKYILIYSGDQVTTEYQIIPADTPDSDPVIFNPREVGHEYHIDHHGDWFYIRTNTDGAVDFKIMKTPVTATSRENWVDVIPYEEGTMISSMTTFKDYLVRSERKDARPRIVISDYAGNESEIKFDQPAYSASYGSGREYATDTLRVYYESPSQPEQIFDYNMKTGERVLRKTQEVPSGHNPDLYVVERLTAIADDGAEIPVMVIRLKQTPLDGSAPVLLYGYGSYGAYIPDGFSTTILSMVDRGMIYALAHIRGGSAKGQQWYLDGKLGKKMNTFTDFVRVGETLVEKNYTTKGNIVIYGGSAGGLLVGAAVNLQPELFAGVLAAVPFVDVLNTISDESLPLTPPEWPEWGDPIRTKEGYEWIAAYSPYDNIQKGVAYPPIFATGGLTDYRVTYWEPTKWVARLRDEAKGGPFILRMNMTAGHGGSAARFERLEERAHLYAYALDLTGLADVEPVKHSTP
ncbi:MAG: S9 family peptidase [bacterium]